MPNSTISPEAKQIVDAKQWLLCPFCGHKPNKHMSSRQFYCRNKECPIFHVTFTETQWNTRSLVVAEPEDSPIIKAMKENSDITLNCMNRELAACDDGSGWCVEGFGLSQELGAQEVVFYEGTNEVAAIAALLGKKGAGE